MSSDEATPRTSGVQRPSAGAPGRARRRWLIPLIVSVIVVVYALVVILYAFSGTVNGIAADAAAPPPGGVKVIFTPESVDAANQRIVMNMRIEPSEDLESEDGLALKRTVNVIVVPVRGAQSTSFAANEVPSTRPVDVIVDGVIENWPFDTYRVKPMGVLAYTTDGGERTPLPIIVQMEGDAPGWGLRASLQNDAQAGSSSSIVMQHTALIEVEASRSWSTLAFGFVLLALMIVMPCLVLFVAISVFRAKRKVEASFMSWMAAMLFATIPLRTFLPGSPPVGSWIDFTVVLWVVVGLISGLAIYVSAWWKWGAKFDRATPVEPPLQ